MALVAKTTPRRLLLRKHIAAVLIAETTFNCGAAACCKKRITTALVAKATFNYGDVAFCRENIIMMSYITVDCGAFSKKNAATPVANASLRNATHNQVRDA